MTPLSFCYDLRFHLYVDPLNPERLLAPGGGAPGKVGAGIGGLSESLDGGKTWNVVGKLPDGVTSEHRISNIVFDPVDINTIYLNADQARVWRSYNKGSAWEVLLSLDKLKTF